jgi:hypothetical protein
MTANQRLRNEAATTCQKLQEAARRLAGWADLLAGDFFQSSLPPEEVRQIAHALAFQGGRLQQAIEQAKPKGAT